MSVNTKRLLIGFGVMFVLSFLLGLFKLQILILPLISVFFVLFGISRTLSGNKAERKASPEERTAALQPSQDPQKASIYVYREGFMGRALGVNVLIDGREVVQLKSPRFSMVHVDPGTHSISANAQNAPNAGLNATTFQVSGGGTVVFRLSLKTGTFTNAVVVTEQPDARAALTKLAGVPLVVANQTQA